MTRYIGITGSIGKSTTIRILGTLLKGQGYSVHEVFKDAQVNKGLEKSDVDFVLIEFSPTVLEKQENLSLDVSVILNIKRKLRDLSIPEEKFNAGYGKIYDNTKEFCIYNSQDRTTDSLVQEADVVEGARAIGFTRSTPSRGQVGVIEQLVVDRAFYDDPTDPLRFLSATEILNLTEYDNLLNPVDVLPLYLVEDVVAALAVARCLGVSPDDLANSLRKFTLQKTQNYVVYDRDLSIEPQYLSGNVKYINDFSSQNPVATLATLKTYQPNSVVLVLGGDTRGLDYSWFVEEAKEFLLAAVVIGGRNHPLFEALRQGAPNIPVYLVEQTEGLQWVDDVVSQVNKLFYGNDIILFSPAADLKPLGRITEISSRLRDTLTVLKDDLHEVSVRLGLTK